ncbi:MAG: DNA-binding response regulator [Bradyrhizobium sp.]|jgi:DNA-binding NarL/FixJ family response regulator|nr:DNA-binding response regulator [Bradyrhizobium sp.]
MPSIRIALVDDHPLMLSGLQDLLSRSGGFEIVATGRSPRDIPHICRVHKPEVIVVDLFMGCDICAVIAAAIRIAPRTKVVAFTAAMGVEPAILALDAGATGYVLKGGTSAELVQAIRSVHAGGIYVTHSFTSEVIARLRDAPFRTKAAKALMFDLRELRIIHLLTIGKTDEQIAVALRIDRTILDDHMSTLRQKFEARNRREAVIEAGKSACPPTIH